jgi:hypothetical protein
MPLPLSRLPTLWLRSIRPRSVAPATALAIFAIAASETAGFAEAKDSTACEQLDWSVKRDLESFRDPHLEMVFSGATLGSVPDKGLVLELQPHGTVDYVLAPGGESKSDDRFAGLLFINNVAQAGTYQVTASQDAWIDLIQDGKALDLSAETLNPNCSDAPKSMRFHLEPGPLTIQVSGASSNRIKLAISPVE